MINNVVIQGRCGADRVDFTGDRRQRTDSSKSDPGKTFGWNEIIEDDGDLPFV